MALRRVAAERVLATVTQGTRFGAYRPLTVAITNAAGKERRATMNVPAAASTTVVVPLQLDAAPRGVTFSPTCACWPHSKRGERA